MGQQAPFQIKILLYRNNVASVLETGNSENVNCDGLTRLMFVNLFRPSTVMLRVFRAGFTRSPRLGVNALVATRLQRSGRQV